MKKLFTRVLLLTLFACAMLSVGATERSGGRSSELTVADGTVQNPYVPIYGIYMDDPQRSQTIYPAEMLTAMAGDTIRGLLYYGIKQNIAWNSVVTVSLGATTTNDLSGGWATDPLTDVFTGTLSLNENQQMEIIFTTPYFYAGGNLLVQFDSPEDGNNWILCQFMGEEHTDASRTAYGTNYATAEGTLRNFIPKTTFTYGAPPTCPKPTNVEVSFGATWATLSWDDASGASSWNIEYGPQGFEVGTGTTVLATTNPFTIEGLIPDSSYSARIQAICSDDDQSEWSGTVFFHTLCDAVTFPYLQTFSEDFPPPCWDRLIGLAGNVFEGAQATPTSSGWTKTTNSYGIEGAHMKLNIYGTARKHWMVSPAFEVLPGTVLSFDLALTKWNSSDAPPSQGGDDKFMVVVLPGSGNVWSIENATIWDSVGTDHVLYDIPTTAQRISMDLSAYAGSEVRVAFYGESTISNADVDLHIGNLAITTADMPICPPPTNLTATTNAAGTSINLSWEYEGADENTTYKVYRGTTLLTTVDTTVYSDVDIPAGEHCYTVSSVCSGFTSDPSNEACATIAEGLCYAPRNLAGVPYGATAKLTWDAPARDSRNILLSEDFEGVPFEGIPDGWTRIDADGDGHEWKAYTKSQVSFIMPHSGTVVLISRSWQGGAALSPDNYLITPLVEGATSMTFYYAVNDYAPADHYSILASTTGNSVTDFTMVYEETPTGRSKKAMNINESQQGDVLSCKGGTMSKDQTSWFERTVELPVGTRYVAFRHHNTTDQDFIMIDDVTITSGEGPVPTDYTFKVYRDDVEVATVNTTSYDDENLTPGTYNYTVKNVCEGGVLSDATDVVTVTIADPADCLPPINLAGVAEGTTAKLTWSDPQDNLNNRRIETSGADMILLSVTESRELLRDGQALIVLEAHSVWDDGSGYQFLLDADHNEYGQTIPATDPLTSDCNIPSTLYDVFEYKIPANADPSCTSSNVVIDGSDSVIIVAGVYDFAIVNPTPGGRIWIAGGGIDPTRADDYTFEAGKRYHFLMQRNGNYDGTGLTISDVSLSGFSYKVFRDDVEIATVYSNSYDDAGLAQGTYNYTVKTVCEGAVFSVPSNVASVTIDAIDCPAPTNLAGVAEGTTAKLTWNAPTGSRDVILSETFETGSLPTGWTTLDEDGDGQTWTFMAPFVGHNGGGCISSASFINNVGPATPDNYLITPDITGGTHVNYFVCAQDGSWPAEHYAVMVSSSGTSASDFTIIFEETLTAKGTSSKGSRGTNAQGSWYEHTLDLPAGTKYVAFRHFNCTDLFWLNLDDVTVTSGEGPVPPPVSDYTFKVYRDNVEIATVNTTSYDDANLSAGTYNYTVKTVCEGGVLSDPSNVASVTIESPVPPVCPAPTNLTATASAGNTINLNWEGASDGSETLSWSGDYSDAIGTNSAADFDVAHKFEASDLSNYVGWRVTKIAFVPCVANCTYSLRAWSGNNAESMILDQEVSGISIQTVNEFSVNTPVTIEANKAFYFGYRCNTQEGFPAGIDAGPAVTGKGDLIHMNGEWAAIAGIGLDNNFCIVTTVSNDRGEEANLVLTPDTDRRVSGTLGITKLPVSGSLYSKDRSFSYKIYRDNAEIATVSETSFTDPNLPNGTYTYYVKTVCDGGMLSDPSNEASATVSITELEGAFNIYPNPANDKIYVEGDNIERVSLYNILGQQLVTITAVENMSTVITTSQLESGIYMLRIVTRDGGVVSQRVVVTH